MPIKPNPELRASERQNIPLKRHAMAINSRLFPQGGIGFVLVVVNKVLRLINSREIKLLRRLIAKILKEDRNPDGWPMPIKPTSELQ